MRRENPGPSAWLQRGPTLRTAYAGGTERPRVRGEQLSVQSISSTNSRHHGTPRYWIVPVRGGAFVQRLSVWFDKVHLQISRIPRAVLTHFTMAEMLFGDVTGVLVYLRCPEQESRANEFPRIIPSSAFAVTLQPGCSVVVTQQRRGAELHSHPDRIAQ